VASFHIPAFCPTCGSVFASGVVVNEVSSVSFDSVSAGPCPNGHMGLILDGTYSALGGLYAFFKTSEAKPAIEQIQRIARSVADKETSAEAGLADMADLLPKDLGAAVKKLGSHNPLTAFLIVLAMISSMAVIGANVAIIYKTLSPNAPMAPTIIINNDATNINSAASGHESNHTIAKPLKQEQARRLKQMHTEEEKRAKTARKDAEAECRPWTDPAHK